MTQIGMLDTSIGDHQKLVEETKEVMTDEWQATKTVAEKISEETNTGFDKDYIRSLLTYIRQHLKKEREIEVKTKRQGGHPTYYWRKKE